MSKPKNFVSPDVKQQILQRVKKGEKPVREIADEHGISPQTIYGWLAHGATAPPSFLELAKLKRENQLLHELIGKLTVELSVRGKKPSIP